MTTYGLVLVAHLLGALFFFGGALVAGVAFEAAARRERPSEIVLPLAELRKLLNDPLSRTANYASSALVVVILVLMVWQPGR